MTKHDIHLIFYLDKVARREEMKVASFDFIDIGSKYRGFLPTKYDKLPAGYPSLPNFLEAVENTRVTSNPYPKVDGYYQGSESSPSRGNRNKRGPQSGYYQGSEGVHQDSLHGRTTLFPNRVLEKIF
jgi:hypothetical protein